VPVHKVPVVNVTQRILLYNSQLNFYRCLAINCLHN